MSKRATTVEPANLTETYQRMLLEKREKVLSGLGVKFDSLARMGRVAEEDQAQISHDEFISLQLNSLDYVQLRLVEEALDSSAGMKIMSPGPTGRTPSSDSTVALPSMMK